MNVFIRADASSHIGSGHITRCLVLAQKLKAQGRQVTFLSQDLPASLAERLAALGCALIALPPIAAEAADFQERDAQAVQHILKRRSPVETTLIVDHYRLGFHWETLLRPLVKKMLVIDDLADRPHAGDALLDVTWCPKPEERYQGLVPTTCRLFLGPRFALLRDEFFKARNIVTARTGQIHHVLVFFGGGDPSGESAKTLDAIERPEFSAITFHLITGSMNPQVKALFARTTERDNIKTYRDYFPISALMAACDLAIGAGGSTSWERCFLRLPAMVICTAPNQETIARELANAGAIWLLGSAGQVTTDMIAERLRDLRQHPEEVRRVATHAATIVPWETPSGADLLIEHLLKKT